MVVLEDIIFIYDIQTMKILHQIITPTNPFGQWLNLYPCANTNVSSHLRAVTSPGEQLHRISDEEEGVYTRPDTGTRPAISTERYRTDGW